ncbi:MAG TPA: hypothetical protein VE998_02070 [Terriglobales bacterium]|nr:hypothetical protein [Terriglobales bacterium]
MTRYFALLPLLIACSGFAPAQDAAPAGAAAYCSTLVSGDEAAALQRACRWVNVLPQAMPAFEADQITSRQQMTAVMQQTVNVGGAGHDPGYQHSYILEVINAKLKYAGGNDDYSDWYLDAKVSSYDAVRTTGLFWSFMQLQRVLETVFAPHSATQFKFVKRAEQKGRSVLVYEFTTPRANNDSWSFVMDGKQVNPGLKGEFALDAASFALVHLKLTTNEIDKDKKVPVKNIDVVADYAPVHVGSVEFVMPAAADIKLCRKDAAVCLNNSISFKNYKPAGAGGSAP